jgi:metallo-beta-lactamase family protein
VHIPDWMDEFELTPSERAQPKTELMGDQISKALLAEQMYLELRIKLNDLFKEKWLANNYDEIIDKMKKIDATLG